MPLIKSSSYRVPWYVPGAHLQTILPNLSRRRWNVDYDRERIELSDGDFVDLDWLRQPDDGGKLMLVLHGLEGSSQAPYAISMARSAYENGFNVAVFNFRGCSGERNRLPRFYHSGETGDLHELVSRFTRKFESISLVGFSLGGNVVLKYMGEKSSTLPKTLKASVAFSVPCDLAGSAKELEKKENAIYMKRFMIMLCDKLEEKAAHGYDGIHPNGCRKMRTFSEFDNEYTAPIHGFRDAAHYWDVSSSVNYLSGIDRPTLLINALNDPFLSEKCFPRSVADTHDHFYLETPMGGGHCAFPGLRSKSGYWHERRAIEFINSALAG